MSFSRRTLFSNASLLSALGALGLRGTVSAGEVVHEGLFGEPGGASGERRLVVPDGQVLSGEWRDGAREYRLVAEEVEQEFAPGMKVKCWGYNGRTPGPVIEASEGDLVRIFVSNHLPEPTTIHWHGILLPCGMDGAGGLTQPHIPPGETWVYEFTLRQHGTFLYHPHSDEMVQMAVGCMGMIVVHPRRSPPTVERDFVILPHEWAIHPGTYRPDPAVMLDFNLFTFNGKVYPATAALVAKTGDRVRIRFGNLSMNQHPIHLHGYHFELTGTDGGPVPTSARFPMATVAVPVGSTRDIEFVAKYPGDWVIHCHKSHHTMNAMGHEVPNLLGVKQGDLEGRIRKMLPGFMAMGETGMADMQMMSDHMPGPENTLPMMAGLGPFGEIQMGGMFTILRVRDELASYDADPGDYEFPAGTVASKVE